MAPHPHFTTREACPACNATSFQLIYQAPFDQPPVKNYLDTFYAGHGGVEYAYLKDAQYILCSCDNCDLIFQKNIPDDMLMERLYENWIDPDKALRRHKKKDGLDHFGFYAREVMQLIAYFKKQPSSLRFFDFGMGWGNWATMVKAFGCTAYGTELSQQRINHARANGINVITWDEIPDQQFDFINTEQVFEHIPHPLVTLKHLKKGLRNGGIIKISVPTAYDIKRRLKVHNWLAPKGNKNSLNPVAPLEHINCYQRKSITLMAKQAGLKEIKIPMHLQYRFSNNWTGIKSIAKNIFKPLSLNVLQKHNYLFFQKCD